PDQTVSPEAMSMLRLAAADTGCISVPLLLGSLAPLDPFVAQLLVAGYIHLITADEVDELPRDKLVYEITERGYQALAG
ncbi:hypothetical protein WDZ92_25960, partial [Nostoc sp. NIES-2111]